VENVTKRLADTLAQGNLAIDLYREIVIACVARDSSQDFARRLGGGPQLSEHALGAIQDAMREHTVKATGAIFVATALHAIAVGNMLPAFHTRYDGSPTSLMTICVDQTEFVISKLKDRGTHQAYGVVTNAQDFMHVLRHFTKSCIQS